MLKFVIAIAMLAFFNIYIAFRIANRWAWAGQHMGVVWGVTLFCVLLQLAGPFGDRLIFPSLRHGDQLKLVFKIIDWSSYVMLGIATSLFIYMLAADLISIVWKLVMMPQNGVNFDRRTVMTLGAVTVGATALGVGQAAAGPKVHRVDIPLKNLPAAFDGFTIAQVSDLHVGPLIGRDYAQNVVDIVNGLKPDLIALTGDFVDGTVDNLRNEVAPLAQLAAPHGIFFVSGNHEYYWGSEAWGREYARLGMRILSNTHERIRRGDDEIILAGVPDYSTLHAGGPDATDPQKSLTDAPQGRVKILLAHQPVTYSLAHAAGFDLQLSGHTHAGQYFPFSLFIGLFQRYYKGLNRHHDMWVYVNRGTGYWGPPLRTGVPSEITLITLRRETA